MTNIVRDVYILQKDPAMLSQLSRNNGIRVLMHEMGIF